MLPIELADNRVHIGERFSVSFQRTLRVPETGGAYPLPPGLGVFPVHRVADFAGRVPRSWSERDAFFIPLYRREALWLGFQGAAWKPSAVKVGSGDTDVVSGEAWTGRLEADPQNYVVAPRQPWLDGINSGHGSVRQFVAVPLGLGRTVDEQLTGGRNFGGIRVMAFEPKPGRFPDRPPPESGAQGGRMHGLGTRAAGMGLGAGGRITQRIYPDPYGLDTWDQGNSGAVSIYLVGVDQYREITGRQPPPTPVDARTYTEYGFPWFELYDEPASDLAPPARLAGVKSVGETGEAPEPGGERDRPFEVPGSQVERVRPRDADPR